MVAERTGQVRHGSDNRVEVDRARHALDLAAAGGRVAVVSSGDPGVFAMATAVLEQLDPSVTPEPAERWAAVDVVVPGVTAATATAALAGAPLGHDCCLISLSDVLKPWDIIERRVDAAAGADFVSAFYNPVSRHRPWQLGRAVEVVRRHRSPDTPVVVGRDVGRPGRPRAGPAAGGVRTGPGRHAHHGHRRFIDDQSVRAARRPHRGVDPSPLSGLSNRIGGAPDLPAGRATAARPRRCASSSPGGSGGGPP